MNKEYELAIEQLTPLTQRSNAWDAAAHYWIGRAQEHLDQDPGAHYAKSTELDSSGWYDLLVKQRQEAKTDANKPQRTSSNTKDFGTIVDPLNFLKIAKTILN